MAKQRWNTKAITDLIAKRFPQYEVKLMEQGGSYDTTEIRVWLAASPHKTPDSAVLIFGMNEEDEILFEETDDVDVDRIHCTANDRYGMEDATPSKMRIVADLTEMLHGAGYEPTSQGWKYFG